MHVVLDARYLNGPDSGIGTYVDNLLRQALALDCDLRYTLVTRKPGLASRYGSRVDEVPFDAPPRSYRTILTLHSAVRGLDYDLFHAPFNLLPRGLAKPAIVTVHDAIALEDPWMVDPRLTYRLGAGRFWRRGLISAVRRADHVITVSESSRDVLIDRFPDTPPNRVSAAAIGGDPFFFSPPSDEERQNIRALTGNAPYVLVVGQGSPRKNHERAVRAFLQAFPAEHPMQLVLVRRLVRGDVELQRLLDSPAARDRVIQVGYVDRPMLRALYAGARVFFFPSILEGFGLPLIEAMAAGTVCVSSDRSAPAEVAADAALKASPYDEAAMAAALRLAHDDEALRTDLITRGARRAREFSYSECARLTLQAYRSIVERAA